MKRFINNVLIILSALIIAVSFSWVFSNRVEAVTNGSVTVKLAPDSSKQKESKVLIVNVSLAGFKNVNLNTPIAMSAVLNYDTSIFSGATITGKNGYSAMMANNKMVIDSNSAKDGDIIAQIDLTIKPNQTEFIKTGLAMEIPYGYVGLIYARSGLACKKGLAPANKVGVIDVKESLEYDKISEIKFEKEKLVC